MNNNEDLNDDNFLDGIDPEVLAEGFNKLRQELNAANVKPDVNKSTDKLPHGKYIGSVELGHSEVKEGLNKGKEKLTFVLRPIEGEFKGVRTWIHQVWNPVHLKDATPDERYLYRLKIYKLLIICGVDIDPNEKWKTLIEKIQNIGANTNKIYFTVKPNPSKPSENQTYIDGIYGEAETIFSMPIGAGLPDGKDFPG